MASEVRRLPSSEQASEAPPGGLKFLVDRVSKNVATLSAGAGRVYTRVTPYVAWGADLAWFAGSTALLLALPVLIEVQRESTVLLMQRQREIEVAQMQEQARIQQGGFVEQMKGLGAMIGGGGGDRHSNNEK